MLSNKGDTERRIVCPYEPSHILLHYRMQTHLVKCRRNHPESKMVICMFNSTHQVPEPELKYHHETCCDRGNLDKFTHVTEGTDSSRFLIPQPPVQLQASENWDDEPPQPTYNPEVYCQNNPILRNNVIHTQSAAVRRNFRMEERQRMQELTGQRTVVKNGNNEREIQQRRPVGASEGIHNRAELVDNDLFDVANLLAKVNLGSTTLTTPRLNATNTAETENEINNDREILTRDTEAAPRTQQPFVENDTSPPTRSTGAIPRSQNASLNQHNSNGPKRSTWTGPGNLNGNEGWASNRSTGTVPRMPDSLLDDQDFPQLGPSRSMNSRNGANFLNQPMSRGRGTRLAKK